MNCDSTVTNSHANDPRPHLRGVAAELLAQGERGGVLGVRAADLDDVRELLR